MRVGMLVVLLVLLAGCGSDSVESERIPTRTLVPPTATNSPEPVSSPTDLPGPSAFVVTPTLLPESVLPPEAQSAIVSIREELALTDSGESVRLLSVDGFDWAESPLDCESGDDLDEGSGLRLVFMVGVRVEVYYTTEDSTVVCDDPGWLAIEGHPYPLDPIAAEMVDLAARDITAPTADLVSLLALDWPDSSLGCPKAGGIYEDVVTPGYRMVFRVGNERIIYHTDTRDVIRCASEEEVLPDILQAALPD